MGRAIAVRVSAGDERVRSTWWSATAAPVELPRYSFPVSRHFFDLLEPEGTIGSVREVDLAFEVGDWVVDEVEGAVASVVRQGSTLSLAIDTSPIDLLELRFLQLLLREDRTTDWRVLADDDARQSWLGACLRLSNVTTPWLWSARGPSKLPELRRDPPSSIEASIRPADLTSPAAFFCHLGEAFLGPGGYLGREDWGMREMVGALAGASVSMRVTVHDPDACRAASRSFFDEADFLDVIVDTLRDRGVDVVLAP